MKLDTSKTTFSALPDEELFLLMSYRESDPENASLAFGEFYNRYQSFLQGLSHSVCAKYKNAGEEISEIVFSNTLFLCFNKAENFIAAIEKPGKADKTVRLKAWLGQMAENEFKKILRSQAFDLTKLTKPDSEELDAMIEKLHDDEDDEGPPVTYAQEKYEEAYNYLTDEEKEVFDIYRLCYADGIYFKSEFIEQISIKMGLRPDSVRQRYYRAIEKLKSKLETIKIHDNYETDRRNHERRNL